MSEISLRTGKWGHVRYTLWDLTDWRRDCSPLAQRNRVTEERKQVCWEAAVRIEKIMCVVLHEAHARQVEEVMEALPKDRRGSTDVRLDLVHAEPTPGTVGTTLHKDNSSNLPPVPPVNRVSSCSYRGYRG